MELAPPALELPLLAAWRGLPEVRTQPHAVAQPAEAEAAKGEYVQRCVHVAAEVEVVCSPSRPAGGRRRGSAQSVYATSSDLGGAPPAVPPGAGAGAGGAAGERAKDA